MSAWDAYPAGYRSAEVNALLSAVKAGECVSIVGLSGAGKSNLIGFLHQRVKAEGVSFVLVDGNRARPATAEGLFRLAAAALGVSTPISEPAMNALESAVDAWMAQHSGCLVFLLDRYDALSEDEQMQSNGPLQSSGPMRALRDAYKYRLAYVTATRRPLDPRSELAELFFANTLWLGPLAEEDAQWSAQQYAGRRGQTWEAAVIDRLVRISWGYPSLLRACCEAYASGAPLESDALRSHSSVRRRAEEFWADSPSAEDVARSGLSGHPLLVAEFSPLPTQSTDLTASEHRLLVYLQAHPGEVAEKDDLIRAVWPYDKVSAGLRDDNLAQLIRRLRKKIGADAIQTIPGRGYRYTAKKD